MPRPKQMHSHEVATWLAVLLDAAFDPSGALSISPGDYKAKVELLALASDFTNYPDDFPDKRRSELLLLWVERWLPDWLWHRLQSRVRKRRARG